MTTNNRRQKIRNRFKEMTICWTKIEDLPALLEKRFGDGFRSGMVMELAHQSQYLSKAWSPGGKHLMVSNCAKVSDFVSIADDREAA